TPGSSAGCSSCARTSRRARGSRRAGTGSSRTPGAGPARASSIFISTSSAAATWGGRRVDPAGMFLDRRRPMDKPVIVSAVRTPIGRFLGTLSPLPATKLGSIVVAEAVKRAGVAPESVDEVVMGNVVSAGLGQNPGRQAAMGAGLPDSIPAMTVNKVCGSGLKAVVLGAQAIQCGDASVVVAGGMESMSNAPYLLKGARQAFRMGNQTLVDSMIHDGLWDAYRDYHMGNTGEVVAERYQVTRDEQDQWALESHRKA